MNPIRKKLIAILIPLLLTLLSQQTACAYYDPGVQRWINRDPFPEFGSSQLYTFVVNNPLTFFDPNGMAPDSQSKPEPPAITPPILPPSCWNSPSGCGAGNGLPAQPVPPSRPTLPTCSKKEVGVPRNMVSYPLTCPCTALVVNCLKWETCEPVQLTVPPGDSPPVYGYYWVPHHKCAPCPEGSYD
jgi:hypothetical protein